MANTIVIADGVEDGLKLFLFPLAASGTPDVNGYTTATVAGIPTRQTSTVAEALVGNFIAFYATDKTQMDSLNYAYGPGYVTLADDTATYEIVDDQLPVAPVNFHMEAV